MLTKSMRYEIVKPIDATWEEFGKVLNDLRYKSAKMANYTVQKCWEWDNFKRDYKEKNGTYPSNKMQPNIYRELAEHFPEIGSGIVSQTKQVIANKYNSDRKEILKLSKSIPSYRNNIPIYLYNKAYIIESNSDNNYYINMRLLPQTEHKMWFKVAIKFGDKKKAY